MLKLFNLTTMIFMIQNMNIEIKIQQIITVSIMVNHSIKMSAKKLKVIQIFQ